MSPKHLLWLALAGAVAASVNAAAGGGTLLSFPSLLAAGLSSLSSNATSTVGLLPGSVGAVFAYRDELRAGRGDAAKLLLPSLIGGLVGAIVLLELGDAVFHRIVPALLIGSSVLLLAQPLVVRAVARAPAGSEAPASERWAVPASFLVAVYAGYFGAGAGILFLGVLGFFLPRAINRLNALKVFVALIANGVSAAWFIGVEVHRRMTDGAGAPAVVPQAALVLAAGSIVGGYLGVHLVKRLPAPVLRGFAAAVGIGIAIYFIVR